MRRNVGQHAVAFAIGLAASLPPALGQASQQPGIVVVTAARPAEWPLAQAEVRLHSLVGRQATGFKRFLNWCRNGPRTDLDTKVLCGRTDILARDKSLGEGLEAIQKQDYTTALARFEAAYAKTGYPDAALILAHMHRHGLGTPRDTAQGIKWLRAVAEARFDPATHSLDSEALRNLRQAAGEFRFAASAPGGSQRQAGDHRIDEALAVVRVTGLRAVPWKSYGAMRAAVSAYEQHKSLAPDAVFRFAVMPPPGMQLPPNFALRVRTKDGQEFPIRLEHGELFTLPPLPDLRGDADLVSNFKGSSLRIGLLVHTPTVSPEKLRLGDARLRYEINTAIAMVDDPWEYDARCKGTSRWNRCKRPSKLIWFRPWSATSGAWIAEGSRRSPLTTNDDPGNPMYRLPIAGERWGNDATIEFDYKMPLQRPRRLFEAAVYDAND